jgi:hypothetical protein
MAFITELLPSLRTAAAAAAATADESDGSSVAVVSVLSGGVHSPFSNYDKDVELKEGSYSIQNAANAAGYYNDLGLDALAKVKQCVTRRCFWLLLLILGKLVKVVACD